VEYVRFGKFLGIFVWRGNVEADRRHKTLNTGIVTDTPPCTPRVVQQHTLLTFRNAYLNTPACHTSCHQRNLIRWYKTLQLSHSTSI